MLNILLNLKCYRWEFTSVRVSPCCVLPSCAFLLYIMSCLSICMFYIDCTAEIKYKYSQQQSQEIGKLLKAYILNLHSVFIRTFNFRVKIQNNIINSSSPYILI